MAAVAVMALYIDFTLLTSSMRCNSPNYLLSNNPLNSSVYHHLDLPSDLKSSYHSTSNNHNVGGTPQTLLPSTRPWQIIITNACDSPLLTSSCYRLAYSSKRESLSQTPESVQVPQFLLMHACTVCRHASPTPHIFNIAFALPFFHGSGMGGELNAIATASSNDQ